MKQVFSWTRHLLYDYLPVQGLHLVHTSFKFYSTTYIFYL